MTVKSWPAAFGISVAVHLAIIAAVGLSVSAYAVPETKYIEVELAERPARLEPVKQPPVAEADAAPQPAEKRRADRTVDAAPPAETVTGREADQPVAGRGISPGTAARAAGPVQAGAGSQSSGPAPDRLPDVVYGPPPAYPSEARLQRWEGTVRVRVLVAATGAVEDLRLAVSSGRNALDQAALDGLRRWRFNPAQLAGRPVAAWVTVPVVFRLE
jgi:protein TonB